MITKASSPARSKTIWNKPPCITSAKTIFDIRISSINCGIITGNPMITINTAFCCARAAIADRKVKTRLRLVPPKRLMPKNRIE